MFEGGFCGFTRSILYQNANKSQGEIVVLRGRFEELNGAEAHWKSSGEGRDIEAGEEFPLAVFAG
jgi:hypothetical protein